MATIDHRFVMPMDHRVCVLCLWITECVCNVYDSPVNTTIFFTPYAAGLSSSPSRVLIVRAI